MNSLFQTPTRIAFLLFALAGTLSAQPPCIDSSLIDPNIFCPAIYDPVCGCNGVTYGNSCEAENFGGVTSWTPGECIGSACDDLKVSFVWAPQSIGNLNILFTDISVMQGGQILSWSWSFGDGTFSTDQHPQHHYASPGNYTVCLKVKALGIDGESCEGIFCQAVTLGNGCGDGCFFDIQYALNGVALHARLSPEQDTLPFFFYTLWSLDGGQATGNGPDFNYQFSEPGRHVLCATYPTGDFSAQTCTVCKAFDVTALCVNEAQIDTVPCPLAFIPVCGCDGVTYNNACEAFNWAGVTSWVPGVCGSVCNALAVDFEGFNSGGSLTVWTFNDLSAFPGGSVSGWYWDFGNGQTSFEQNPTINFLDPGDYTVCLTVTGAADDGTQCGNTICKTIHIPETLCIDPTIIDPTVFCPALYDPVCGCDGNTYYNSCVAQYYNGVTSWTPGICPTDCINPAWIDTLAPCIEIYDPVCGCDSVTYDNECYALIHGVTSWKKGKCCANLACKAYFSLEILPNRTVLLSDSSYNAESWLLEFGDGDNHSGYFDSLYHKYDNPGIYQICLSISNFAGDCTDKYCVLVDFSIIAAHEPGVEVEAVVVPNPVNDKALVRLNGAAPERAFLFDIFGKKLLDKTVSSPEFELDLAELPAGIYLLGVDTDRGRVVRKVAVSH